MYLALISPAAYLHATITPKYDTLMKVDLKFVMKPSWFCHGFFITIRQIMHYEITYVFKKILLVASMLSLLRRC